MKSFRELMQELSEASLWPGTPEYKKKFGSGMPDDKEKDGSRHKIEKSAGVVKATRKYDSESGESEEPTKNREDAAAAPVKRGRGRPPGKYGSYKKKVKESMDILESLETEEEILEFINSLDEESFNELESFLSEEKVEEELKGKQHKLDMNKNNKLDAHDFKLLRAKKKNEEVEVKEEQIDESVSRYAAFISTENK